MTPVVAEPTRALRNVTFGRPGFTLMEVLVASGSVLVLAGALMSCLLIAGRALNEDCVAPAKQIQNGRPLELIVADARHAMSFSECTAQAMTFQVPDRDGDTVPETIRYSWSGTTSDPLMVEYNGSAPSVFVNEVTQFTLSYQSRMVTGTGFAKGVDYDDGQLLAFHEDAPGGHFSQLGVMQSIWHALYFEPNLPVGTTRWDLTRLRLSMKRSSNPDGNIAIQIRPPAGGTELQPSDTVLDEIVIHESTLGLSFKWYEFDYGAVTDRPSDEGLFVVIRCASTGTVVALVRCEVGIDDQPGMATCKTEDAGETWRLLSGEILFQAYGRAYP